jgi:hypothetical protein
MQASKIIKALDSLGYDKETVEKRSWIGKNISEGSTLYHRRKYGGNIDVLLTGSRREGLATSFDNDVDQMFVDKTVMCTESKQVAQCNNDNYHAVFHIDIQRSPPGYTCLKLFRKNTADIPEHLKDALVEYNGSILLRNDKVTLKAVSPLLGTVQKQLEKRGWMKKSFKLNVEKNGPSVSFSLSVPYINISLQYDDCLAFKCNASSLLKTWCNRDREHDWPPRNLIARIKDMTGHVVPVGMKGHPEHFLQWRICFTEAEIALVQSFNDTQIKVYAIVKKLSKRFLKPICRGITSYVMKNIIFWISEEVPMVKFEMKDFTERIYHVLYFLKTCISERKLSSYMIPSRNLLESKVSNKQQSKLLEIIECLMLEGPCVALRIPEVLEKVTHLNKDNKETILPRKNDFIEQVYLAPFALPPNDTADFLMVLLDEPTPEKILDRYMSHVVPYIRTHNPQGFFNILVHGDKWIYYLIKNFSKL